jgi:hypothetical protein
MAVAHSAASESHTGTTGSTNQTSFSWTHTQTGTPQGVLVFVHTISATDTVTSVTYGGTGLTRVDGGAAIDSAGEPGRTDLFFLGSGLASGNQTITVNRTNNATVMYAAAATVTAATDTNVTGIVLLEGDGTMAVQSVTDGGAPTNSLRYAGAYSGLASPPPAGTGSTLLTSIDFGQFGAAMVRETTAGTGARDVGFNSNSDDRAAVHVAVRELWNHTETPVVGSCTLTGNEATFVRGKVFLAGSTTVNTLFGGEELNGRNTNNILSVATNAALNPFGTQNAELITENTVSGTRYVVFNVALASGIFTASCYYKSNGRGFAYLYVSDTVAGVCGLAYVNLSTGVATLSTGSSASAVDAGNGWWRLAVTGTANGNINGVRIGLANSSSSTVYSGNGTSGIYAWGAQVVHASEAGEYKRNPAVFVLERPSATLAHKLILTADPVSFALTGNDATLAKSGAQNPNLAADSGVFALTGNDATMRHSYSLVADAGVFTAAGQPATLRHNPKIDGARGAFALTGGSPALLRGYYLSGGAGTFTETGQPATFRRTRAIQGGTGAFSLTGYPAALTEINAYQINALVGALSLTGNAAQPARSLRFSVVAGGFSFTGQAAGLRQAYALTADRGQFALTGGSPSLTWSRRSTFNTGSFSLTGNTAALLHATTLTGETGAFALTGLVAGLAKQSARELAVNTGLFSLTGRPATLKRALLFGVSSGSFTLSSPSPVLQRGCVTTGGRGEFLRC